MWDEYVLNYITLERTASATRTQLNLISNYQLRTALAQGFDSTEVSRLNIPGFLLMRQSSSHLRWRHRLFSQSNQRRDVIPSHLQQVQPRPGPSNCCDFVDPLDEEVPREEEHGDAWEAMFMPRALA